MATAARRPADESGLSHPLGHKEEVARFVPGALDGFHFRLLREVALRRFLLDASLNQTEQSGRGENVLIGFEHIELQQLLPFGQTWPHIPQFW